MTVEEHLRRALADGTATVTGVVRLPDGSPPAAAPSPARARKYGNRPTVADGVRFDSAKEARRYQELRLMEAAGDVTGLELQPRFPLVVNGLDVGVYTGDFRYATAAGEVVVEDVKGGPATRTTAYKLRKKLVLALYGVTIQEV